MVQKQKSQSFPIADFILVTSNMLWYYKKTKIKNAKIQNLKKYHMSEKECEGALLIWP